LQNEAEQITAVRKAQTAVICGIILQMGIRILGDHNGSTVFWK